VKRNGYRDTDNLQRAFSDKAMAIRTRLEDFASVRAEDYFYELAYCLLTPQSSAVNAGKAVDALKQANLLHCQIDPAPLLREKSSYIRFHNAKARNLLEAKDRVSDVLSVVKNGSTAPEKREWLVENIRGLGMKEASHFLRNIGHRDLAILDRHILRNLLKHRVIRSIPQTLTKKRYLAIEEQFRFFARKLHLTMDELDLFFWSSETGEILK